MSQPVISLSLRQQLPTVALAAGHLNAALAQLLDGAYRVVGQAPVPDALEAVLREQQPDAVIVSRYAVERESAQPLDALLAAWRRAAPAARFVWLLGAVDDQARALVRTAATYGMYHLVAGEDIAPADLEAALREPRSWADIAPYLPDGLDAAAPEPVRLTVAAPPAPAAAPAAVARYAHVVAVVSGKGGVGKTAVSANLLAAARDRGAIGLDLDAAKPDLLWHFVPEGAPPADLRDLLQTLNLPADGAGRTALDRADLGLLAEWMDKLPEVLPGVTVVPGPSRDLAYTTVPPAVVEALIARAATKARFVVCDTAFEIADQASFDALSRADTLLVVTTPDHGSVYQTAWFLEELEALHIPRGKLRLVVTHTGQKGLKGAAEIAQALRLPLALQTPYEPQRYEAARVSRKPVALREGPQGPYHQLLTQLDGPPDAGRGGRRGWPWGRRARAGAPGGRS